MENIPIITLTTDFGDKDPSSAIMKGTIFSINPQARIVDLTHEISKYDVREAALIIGMSFHEFPPRSIHVVVTDPGVGSARRPIMVIADDYYFIGPDNGVFSMIYNRHERYKVVQLTSEHYFRHERSATFHGRDIFAPVAAWLSRGIVADNFGVEIKDVMKLPIPSPSMPTRTALEGEVIYIDTFGNAITNIRDEDLKTLRAQKPDASVRFLIKGHEVALKQYYSQVENRGLYALINSMNYLELFAYRGHASREFDIQVGDTLGILLT
ncbi:MAG: SAM-dependent chlorinase/fluorinase [Thermodesulfovibrionales bacterium]